MPAYINLSLAADLDAKEEALKFALNWTYHCQWSQYLLYP